MFAAARAVLDRRLARDADWPVLVACSGGGNSTALLLAARAWAAGAGRTSSPSPSITACSRNRPIGPEPSRAAVRSSASRI